jgi:hypothetical protein
LCFIFINKLVHKILSLFVLSRTTKVEKMRRMEEKEILEFMLIEIQVINIPVLKKTSMD